nr:humanin-like 6 [Myodes glareolus]
MAPRGSNCLLLPISETDLPMKRPISQSV